MSGVFYGNPRFQQQRPQPNSATVQRLLDENASLIQTIIEYQKRGSLPEVYEYEQVLHRNLVYLAQLADPSVNTVNTLPPPQPPISVNGPTGGSTSVRMPNVTLGQMPGANQPRPQQPPSSYVDGTVRPTQVQQSPAVGMSQQPQQPPQHAPQPTTPQMAYRPAQVGPPQPQQSYGPPSQYGGQPPQSSYGQAPPQMVQMIRQPGQMQPGPQMGMAPQQNPMMRHPQQAQYVQPSPGGVGGGMYGQPNGPMGMQPMGGPPQQMQQMQQGYQQNYQPGQ